MRVLAFHVFVQCILQTDTLWPITHASIRTHTPGSCDDASLSYWLTGVFSHEPLVFVPETVSMQQHLLLTVTNCLCMLYLQVQFRSRQMEKSCGWPQKVCSASTELDYHNTSVRNCMRWLVPRFILIPMISALQSKHGSCEVLVTMHHLSSMFCFWCLETLACIWFISA